MEPIDDLSVWRIVAACLELSSLERTEYLAKLRADQPHLAVEAERLLAGQDAMGSFLSTPLTDDTLDAEDARLEEGALVGKYRVVRRIASGGMGDIYLAHRVEDFSAVVALKIVRSDRTDPELLNAFQQERQTLADLASDRIVRILDAGTHDDGRLFLVMELVDGVPIDEYCRSHNLSRREALGLFLNALETIGMAHASEIVHADLKPRHLLVDKKGVIKVLDFGIAVRHDVGAAPLRLWTPAYASPEQRSGEEPTPASDVYALGKVLRLLLDAAPARNWFERFGRPEIDAVVQRCLCPSPAHRYLTASQLAADIRAHLECRPIPVYRENLPRKGVKLLARHRVASLLVCSLVLLAVVAPLTWRQVRGQQEAAALHLAKEAMGQLTQAPREALRLAYQASVLSDAPDVVESLRRSIGNPLQQVVRVPEGSVCSIAFSSDGRLLAAASTTGKVSLFQLTSDRPPWSFNTRLGNHVALQFVANDRLLELNGGTELWYVDLSRREMLFGVSTGTPLEEVKNRILSPSGRLGASWNPQAASMDLYEWSHCCMPHNAVHLPGTNRRTNAVAFDRSEERIALGGLNRLQLFAVPEGTPLASAEVGGHLTVTTLCFPIDEGLLLGGMNNGTLRAWHSQGLSAAFDVQPHTSSIVRIDCTGKEHLVTTLADDGSLAVSDIAARRVLVRKRTDLIGLGSTWLRFSDDATVVMIGTQDGRVGVWRWATQERPVWSRPHRGAIIRGSIDALHRWISTQSSDGTMRIWDVLSGDTVAWVRWREQGTVPGTTVRVLPLTRVPIVSAEQRAAVPWSTFLITTEEQHVEITRLVRLGDEAPAGRFVSAATSESSDGALVAVADDRSLRVWDTRQRRWLSRTPLAGGHYSDVRFMPSTHVVLAFERNDRFGILVDADTGRTVAPLKAAGRWQSVTSTSNGHYVGATFEALVRVWDVRTGDLIFQQPVATTLPAVAVDPEGREVAIGDGDGAIRIWKIPRAVALDGQMNVDGVTTMAFDETARYLAAAGKDGTSAWNAATQELLVRAPASQDSVPLVTQASFDPGRGRLIAIRDDGRLEVWDLANRTVVMACCQHPAPPQYAVYSPDGAFVGTQVKNAGNEEGFVWAAQSGALVRHNVGQFIQVFSGRLPLPSFSPDSRMFAAVIGGKLREDDLTAPSRGQIAEPNREPNDVKFTQFAFSRNGLIADTVRSGKPGDERQVLKVVRRDLPGATVVEDIGGFFDGFTFSPSGHFLGVQKDVTLQVWNTRDGKLTAVFREGASIFRQIGFSTDDRFVLAVRFDLDGPDRRVNVWDVTTTREVVDVPGIAGALSPDGRGVAVVSHGRVLWYSTPELIGDVDGLRGYARQMLQKHLQAGE